MIVPEMGVEEANSAIAAGEAEGALLNRPWFLGGSIPWEVRMEHANSPGTEAVPA